MSTSSNLDRICVAALALAVLIAALAFCAPALGYEAASGGVVLGYEERLFDTSVVHTIDIVMDDWEGFIAGCEDEEYVLCDLVIDGEEQPGAGIRAKGNTSLSSVAAYGNDRYSFKIEFDHYDSSLSYYGLDKLNLNNIIQDNTYMKDFLSYQLMAAAGAAAPLCSYVWITVNGEDWGLYLAVEGVEESFLLRNYGTDYGELYKPDSMEMGAGRGNGGGFDMDQFQERFENDEFSLLEGTAAPGEGGFSLPEGEEMPAEGGFDRGEGGFGGRGGMGGMPSDMGGMPDMSEMPEMGEIPDMGEMPEMGGGMGGGMMGGSSDVLLVYTDDDYDSYANIFDNAKTDVSNADKDRLIDTLQALGEGGDVSDCVDIESVISYFVAHNFVCNFDSYTGSMIHNYYLYEGGGVLSCLQCLCQCLVRGGEDGLIVGVYDLSGQGAGGLLDVAGARPVHGGLARVARLGEICRQRGRLLHRARVRQAVLGPYDDVGAVGLLHVQPDVRAARGFERQLVVLRVRAADQYLVAPARNKAHGAQRLGAALLAAALRRAKDPRGDELPAQLRYLLLARSAGQQVQHAFEVVQHGLALGYELGQVLLGGDGLFVLLVGRSGVLLRRFHRVERYLYLGAALGVVVLTDERPRALFRAPEVRRDEVAAAAQLFPVRRARKLRTLLAQLAGLPVPQGADCLDRVVRDAAHALGALPARVEFLKQV